MNNLWLETWFEIIFQDTPIGTVLLFLCLLGAWNLGRRLLRAVRAASLRRQRRREMAAIPRHELPFFN